MRRVGRCRREARLEIVRSLARGAALGEEVVAQPAGQIGDLAGIGGMPGREHDLQPGPEQSGTSRCPGRWRESAPGGHRGRRRCARAGPRPAPRPRSPEVPRGARARNRSSDPTATSRRSSRRVSALRSRGSPSRASSRATSASTALCARPMRRARSSASSTSRGVSVSSATAKPGSTSASSGNSPSSDRQNASMVLIATSLRRPRSSRQVGSGIRPCSPSRVRSATMRARISAAALRVKVIARMRRGSMPRASRLR